MRVNLNQRLKLIVVNIQTHFDQLEIYLYHSDTIVDHNLQLVNLISDLKNENATLKIQLNKELEDKALSEQQHEQTSGRVMIGLILNSN